MTSVQANQNASSPKCGGNACCFIPKSNEVIEVRVIGERVDVVPCCQIAVYHVRSPSAVADNHPKKLDWNFKKTSSVNDTHLCV